MTTATTAEVRRFKALHPTFALETKIKLIPCLLLVCAFLLSLVAAEKETGDATDPKEESRADLPAAAEERSSRECFIYLAPSTIPGSGLGMFAGSKPFGKGEYMTRGDVILPVVELDWHIGFQSLPFLWDDYTWNGEAISGMEEDVDDLDLYAAASPGAGAAANCLQPLVNIKEVDSETRCDNAGLSSDGSSPGVGAFSPFYNRRFRATRLIQPGTELFVDYGNDYFETRAESYGYIPLRQHYRRANTLLRKLIKKVSKLELESKGSLMEDYWSVIIAMKSIWTTSRILQAIPEDQKETFRLVNNGGVEKLHQNRSIRSLSWLEEHGQCMDNIREGVSEIAHAGRGAFAARPIPAGGLVSPAPLVHIPDKSILTMYSASLSGDNVERARDKFDPTHQQLMLNYCFGHPESTLLLCPYGLLTSYINHAPSKDRINAKVQWSKKMRHPEWLEQKVSEWGDITHNGLSFDVVATRAIDEGEEILIDYGGDWQRAWDEHVTNFKTDRPDYRSANELNEMIFDELVRTVHERPQYHDLRVRLLCRPEYLAWNAIQKADEFMDCQVLKRWRNESTGEYRYLAEAYVQHDSNGTSSMDKRGLLWDVTRDAFFFQDVPYGRDHHQTWSFRNTMYLPEGTFPDIWKNVKSAHGQVEDSKGREDL